jgi:DNA-binding transcriptional regulator YbjK
MMEEKRILVEEAAREMAADIGFINITRKELCERAGIPDGAFFFVMDESFTDFMDRLAAETDTPQSGAVNRVRALPTLRRRQLLDVAIELSRTVGYDKVTRHEIADAAEISPALVSHYFKTVEQLREVILRTAVKRAIPEIVAQGIIRRDPVALQAPAELKTAAAEYVLGL